jgi:hypothetical protein
MDLPSSEVLKVIYALLPGFVAAWIFYGLTAHPRQSPFERVVQALIFTGIVQALVAILRGTALYLGRLWAFMAWTESTSLVVSMGVAVILGITVAVFANKDWFHTFLREFGPFKRIGGLTKKTSFPSEWFSAFCREPRYVVLHLTGSRRLFGWPYEWPDSSEIGHFVLTEAEWLMEDGTRCPLQEVERILVPARDVEMVEFLTANPEPLVG